MDISKIENFLEAVMLSGDPVPVALYLTPTSNEDVVTWTGGGSGRMMS